MQCEKYKRIKTLGRGKFGVVYLASEGDAQKWVAIKKYTGLRDKDIPYQILREISVMKVLQHPNLIQLSEVYEHGYDIEMIMEYGGDNLESFYRKTTLSERINILPQITQQILSACLYLHNSGILHRDLKPENILIKDGTIKLCDFGLAKRAAPHTRRHSYQMGTLRYRPPELFTKDQQEYDQSVDVWSLGCLLYEFIIGEPIFSGESDLVVLRNIVLQIPTTPDDLVRLKLPPETPYNAHTFYKLPDLYTLADNLPKASISRLESFKSLIQSMLVLRPENRISLKAVVLQTGPLEEVSCNFDRYFYKRPHCAISVDLRYVWIDYMIDTFSKYKLNKQTLVLAINIFDEYVNTKKPPIEKLNIIATVSLILASKQTDLKALRMDSFATIYGDKPLIEWERRVIQGIKYHLYQPTILNLYCEIFPDSSEVNDRHWNIIVRILQEYKPLISKNIAQTKSLLEQRCSIIE